MSNQTNLNNIPFRIGNGYDAHRLVTGRKLILGGVHVPYDLGLLGHSDADVLLHALMDALLGAAGKGDIGKHFPDNVPSYKDISSMILLRKVADILKQDGFVTVNVDCTVVAQKPKLSTYTDTMERNIADCLSISPEFVNIKAKTEEGMGFTGSGEGIAAYAVALVTGI